MIYTILYQEPHLKRVFAYNLRIDNMKKIIYKTTEKRYFRAEEKRSLRKEDCLLICKAKQICKHYS